MEHATEDNRRRWSRFPIEMRVELFADRHEAKAFGRAVDLSEGGMRVQAAERGGRRAAAAVGGVEVSDPQ